MRPAAKLSADQAALAALAAGGDRDGGGAPPPAGGRCVPGPGRRGGAAGEVDAGHALLGRDVLPTGVVPLTAIPTTLAYCDAERVNVAYLDGRVEERGLDTLGELVTESGNPGNQRRVAGVTVGLAASPLANGLELVDTSGAGSMYEHNTTAAASARGRMDAGILVLSADPPISAGERALAHQLRNGAVVLFCVLNKIDYLPPAEAAQARRVTAEVLAGEFGRPVPVWPLSARRAVAARQQGADAGVAESGLGALEQALTGCLTDRQDTDLARSVAARVAGGIAEEAAATLAALALSEADLQRRLVAFTDRLCQVEEGRAESAALAAAEVARPLSETNDQAEIHTRSAVGPIQRAVRDALAGLDGPLGVVEQQVLEIAADRIHSVVDPWREQHADAAVRALDDRLACRLDRHITAVRRTADSLFDLQPDVLPPAWRLVDSTRFCYLFAADPGQTEALAAAVRTRLPGTLGGRRVARYVEDRAVGLLDRRIGRARADFQVRRTETRRLLLRGLDRRFGAGAGRIGAIRRASALSRTRPGGRRPSRVGGSLAAASALAGRLAQDRTAAGTVAADE